MRIQVEEQETIPTQVKVFIEAFAMGQEAARKLWGDK